MRDRQETAFGTETRYEQAEDERGVARAVLDTVLVVLGVAFNILLGAWNLILHVGLPAVLTWGVGTARGLDVLSPLIDAPLQHRLGPLALLLSITAAIITTESVTRLGRPFGLGKFFVTTVAVGAALFPFLAVSHRLTVRFTPDQIAVVLSYAYLALRVAIGVLIGAIVSWVLLSHPALASGIRRR